MIGLTKFAESVSEKKLKISVIISQSYKQEGGCLVHCVRLATTLPELVTGQLGPQHDCTSNTQRVASFWNEV